MKGVWWIKETVTIGGGYVHFYGPFNNKEKDEMLITLKHDHPERDYVEHR